MPQISILQTTSYSIANKLISTEKDYIDEFGGGKVIVQVNIVGKELGMRFVTPRAGELLPS